MGQDHIWFESDQFGRVPADFGLVGRGPARLELHVAANRPTKFLKFLFKGLYLSLKFHIARACRQQHANTPHTVSLLCTHASRQHRRCNA